MFRNLKNIDTAFQQIKMLAIAFAALLTLLAGYISYVAFQAVRAKDDLVYILDEKGQMLTASASSLAENRPVEARDHVKRFHELFYTLDPDQKAIDANVGAALFLADATPKRLYDTYKERGYYNELISADASQKIKVDSVVLNTATRPFYAKCYATMAIVRATSINYRALVTECYLRDLSTRTDNNTHGFLIERWQVLANNDLRTEAR